MSFAGICFDQLDVTLIARALEAGAGESVSLKFKARADGNADNDKREFLTDVSAFANRSGGYLIIGVHEKAAVGNQLIGLDDPASDGERRV